MHEEIHVQSPAYQMSAVPVRVILRGVHCASATPTHLPSSPLCDAHRQLFHAGTLQYYNAHHLAPSCYSATRDGSRHTSCNRSEADSGPIHDGIEPACTWCIV